MAGSKTTIEETFINFDTKPTHCAAQRLDVLVAANAVGCHKPFPKCRVMSRPSTGDRGSAQRLNLFSHAMVPIDSKTAVEAAFVPNVRPFGNTYRHTRNRSSTFQERSGRIFRNKSSTLQERGLGRTCYLSMLYRALIASNLSNNTINPSNHVILLQKGRFRGGALITKAGGHPAR